MKSCLLVIIAAVLGGVLCACEPAAPPPASATAAPDVPASSEAWSYQGANGWRINTPHYTIYTTIAGQKVRQRLGPLMEGALAQYQQLVPQLQLSRRQMDCYLFETRQQWIDFTQATTGADASIFVQVRRGGFTVGDRYVAYFIGLDATASVASHEGWHQFAFRHFLGRLPPFLEEGLACTFEDVVFEGDPPEPHWNDGHNPVRARELAKAVADKQTWPLEQLIRMHAGEMVKEPKARIQAYYAQCWAFARFMQDRDGGVHQAQLAQWLADTVAGECFDPTGSLKRIGRPWNPAGIPAMVEHYLGTDLNQVQMDFDAYVERLIAQESGAPAPQ
jgi:hypothetical protein